MDVFHTSRRPSIIRRTALSLGVAVLFGWLGASTLDIKIPVSFSQSYAHAAVTPSYDDGQLIRPPGGQLPNFASETAPPAAGRFPEPGPASQARMPDPPVKLDAKEAIPDVSAAPADNGTVSVTDTVPRQSGPKVKTASPHWGTLILRLAADGFDASQMETLFSSLNCQPLPEFMAQKAVELYGRYGSATLNLPDERRTQFVPPDYTGIAGGMTLAAGRKVIQDNKNFFERLYKQYGVPAPFVVAVMMVETGLGAELGKQSALLALGSMAVTDSLDHVLPVVRGINKNKDEMRNLIKARSEWAYKELKALIWYAEASGKDAAAIPGSIYGAIGICQFMPSNIPVYGVSTNKNNPVPDVFLFTDAATSIARYLSAHGWRKAQTPAAQIKVLLSYNNSAVYASTVYGVANALMSPTTHQSAISARSGGNAVKAARESARTALPPGKSSKTPIKLQSYSDLLK